MMELLSAARVPVAVGLIFAVILIAARAFGIGGAQTDRDIAQLVMTTTIIATAANIGNDVHHHALAMAAGVLMSLGSGMLLRRVMP